MLVSYSDSEGSGDEGQHQVTSNPPKNPPTASSQSNFSLDRLTGKIRVNLQDKPDPGHHDTHDDEPKAKKPRLGASGSAFSDFNAMLPAPKRDNVSAIPVGGNTTSTRKVFSLRTGAEPAFSRESDAELRDLFSDQSANGQGDQARLVSTIPAAIPKPAFAKPGPPVSGDKAFLFKPLSVTRNNKKKTTSSVNSLTRKASESHSIEPLLTESMPIAEPPKKKISLFSAEIDNVSLKLPLDDENDEIVEDLGPANVEDDLDSFQPSPYDHHDISESQSLDAIANDLNLTAAARRQLFGRGSRGSNASAINVINFNTDAEYAANQQLISSGEKIQHNPVRAIASGKHSLKQLVSSAANQKEALEESFAAGRRNKKEAGNKYGW